MPDGIQVPDGIRSLGTLRGHSGPIGRIAWSPNGNLLATASADKTIRLWDVKSGKCARILEGHRQSITAVIFSPNGDLLASGGGEENAPNLDSKIRVWDVESGKLVVELSGHLGCVSSLAFNPNGRMLVSGSYDESVKLWEIPGGNLLDEFGASTPRKGLKDNAVFSVAFTLDGQSIVVGGRVKGIEFWNLSDKIRQKVLRGHGWATNITFLQDGSVLASGGADRTINVWDLYQDSLKRTLEGHTDAVTCIVFSLSGKILISKGRRKDSTIRLWHLESGRCIAVISEPTGDYWMPGLAAHPTENFFASVGEDRESKPQRRDSVIHLWSFDPAILIGNATETTVQYVNAKVVLIGDTGVGKSGLSLVLNNQPFMATESTPGRKVWTLASNRVDLGGGIVQLREALLWDMAGQPGYRIIHQLHLGEVAVALVVFDSRSETDPLAGVRHWERALRLAQQRQGRPGMQIRKFLVSARNDRGGISIGEERLTAVLREFGFDKYFKTSAKEGWEIAELRGAIESAIPWDSLPAVSSSQLFAEIKGFLLDVKKRRRLLAPESQLYSEFLSSGSGRLVDTAELKAQFETCVGRLGNRDLLRRLTFGGHVLLQPELLDDYASSMVNAAKEEPDGLGSLPEEAALLGQFFVPKENRIADGDQEQLLLMATVEELVRHDLALRENADDGRYLVFPSQFNRDFEDAPEPKGQAVAIQFEGPVQSVYSTLAVRLGHSGLFTTGRAEMWRNAAIFLAKAGGRCGLYLHEFAEGRGRLILFFDDKSSAETRFHFEEFVLSHVQRRALDKAVDVVRFFVCKTCGDPVPDSYVKRLRAKGAIAFGCPCGNAVPLAEPRETLYFESAIAAMDRSADVSRDFDAFVISANGETATKSFLEWAGGRSVTLAIVFTDIIGSTALGEDLRDEMMSDVRRAHFVASRRLIAKFGGREIKTIGDSFMAAFRAVDSALDYAWELKANTGHSSVKIRAGIHVGPMQIEENDVFGGTVNFAARIVGAIPGDEVWMSGRAKEDVERLGAARHQAMLWREVKGSSLKGFRGEIVLWAIGD